MITFRKTFFCFIKNNLKKHLYIHISLHVYFVIECMRKFLTLVNKVHGVDFSLSRHVRNEIICGA